MGTEPRTISKADALAEAYKRGLLPPDKKAAYEEAQRRGLVGGQPAAVAQPAAPQAAPRAQAPVAKPGAGFEMMPSSPQARRDMLGAQPPQPMAAAPGAQYSWTPPAELGDAQSFADARTRMDTGAKAQADRIAADAEAAREAQRRAERREAAAAYGAGMDMIITTDDQGQLRPGSSTDDDIAKGIITSPIRAVNAGIGAGEALANLYPDAINSIAQEFTSGPGMGKMVTDAVPRASIPRVPVPEGLESTTGGLMEGLGQFLIARKLVGSVAPGGGLAANIGKDALAIGVGYDGSTGRLADMFDLNAIPEGPLRDYAAWLQTQPEDSPFVGRFKNMLEDMTMSGPMLAPQGVVRAGQAVGNMLTPKPMTPANAGGAGVQAAMAQSRAAPQPPLVARPAPAAAQPSVPPVAQPTVTQGPAGGAQPGATGAGQQAAGAVPPAGPATLQGVATQPPISKQQALIDRDTIKITRRIMRSAGIKDADVMGYLPGAVKRFESLNDPRIPLAFFLKSDLPKHFPEEVANRVGTNLDVWGRARNAETGVNDTSRATINKTITELRKTQQDFLTQSAERNLFKGSLIGQEDQIVASLRETGRKGYEPVLDNARQAVDGRRVPTQDEAAAVEEIRGILSDPMMLGYVDDATRIRAKKEGVDLDQMLKDDPIGSAHWLQSEFRRLSDAAEDAVTGKPTRMSQAYDDLRDMVLDPLKRAAPGYEGAMNRYGHLYGAKDAVRFGKGIFTAGRSAYDTAQKVRAFKKLGRRQQTVAWKSVRDEFLNEFRGTPEDAAAKVTRMQSEGALDILEQLGPRGKRFADDIRSIAQVENPNLRAIEQKSGPVTYDNQRGGVNAQDMVQSPFNQTVGQFGNPKSVPMTIVGDVLLAQAGYPPLLTLSKGVSWTIDKFGNPSKKVLARATEGLYGLPKGNALTSPAKPKRVTGPKSPAAAALEAEEAEDMAELLRALDQTEKNPKTRGGRKGQAILNKIDAAAKAPPANRLKAPKPPPAKTGGKKPPQSNASPMVTSALIGGAAGAAAAPEDARGIGLVAGLAGGAFLGNRLSKMGGSKPGVAASAPARIKRIKDMVAVGDKGVVDVARSMPKADVLEAASSIASQGVNGGVRITNLDEAIQIIDDAAEFRSFANDITRSDQGLAPYPELRTPMKSGAGEVVPFSKPKPAPGAGGKPQPVGAKAALDPDLPPPPKERFLVGSDGSRKSLGTAGEEKTVKFTAPSGKQFQIEFRRDGDAMGVDFREVGAKAGYKPTGTGSAGEANAVLSAVQDAIKSDVSQFGRPRYTFVGETAQQSRIYQQMARTTEPPKGYRWEGPDSNGAVHLQRADLAPPSKGPGGKPPPVQAGTPKPPPAAKPKNALSGIAGRAAVGAGLGAALVGDAEANNDLTGKIGETEMSIAELKKALADFDKLDARGKQQFLKDAGFYSGRIDGNIAGMTTEGMERWTAKQEAALSKAEDELTDLVRRDAYQRNHPNPVMSGLREYGPIVALGVALYGTKFLRGSAAKKSVAQAATKSNELNQHITNVPKGGLNSLITKADTSRPANLNTLWQKGGASKDQLPFKQDAYGAWKPNPKAKPAEELFPEDTAWQTITRYIKGKDLTIIMASGFESVAIQPFIDKAEKNLGEREQEWKDNPSDETFKRFEDAKNELLAYQTAQRIGWGVAGGRVLGAVGAGYAKPRPNIPLAATEQAGIKKYIAANKPPPKPRSPRPPGSPSP